MSNKYQQYLEDLIKYQFKNIKHLLFNTINFSECKIPLDLIENYFKLQYKIENNIKLTNTDDD